MVNTNFDSVISTIMTDLAMNETEVEQRKAFFGLHEPDTVLLKALHEPFTRDLQQRFTDGFYAHLLNFSATRELVHDDATLARLKQTQSAYFNKLTAGDYGVDYVQNRIRVGVAHEKLGLSPHWYIGAYCQYLSGLLPEVWNLLKDEPEYFISTWQALQKLVLFDISLAMETYIHLACQRIQAEHELSEQARSEAQSHSEQLERQEFEIEHLTAMAGLPATSVTALLVGVKSLNKANPEVFESLLTLYQQLLDNAIKKITYKTEQPLDTDLRAFADRLGVLKASPRDVVELHSESLKKKLAFSASLPQFYLEEARLMSFELLGYLTSYYRNYYLRPRVATSSNTDSQPLKKEEHQ